VRAGDTFRLTPGSGGRVTFPRSNLGTLSLDIGTVETQTVNGIGGDDSFTISDLTGVADLTAVNFNGGAGNNTPAGCCQHRQVCHRRGRGNCRVQVLERHADGRAAATDWSSPSVLDRQSRMGLE
jgi:hypothetical protein